MLCLSEFYFLNRSSAKQSANSSDELTCDHDKNTLIECKDMVKELEKKLDDLEERRAGLEPEMETYWPEYKDLLGGKHGYVYLDTNSPRICIRGSMDRDKEDFGYPWLADDEIFSFYDMRAAPVSTALHDFNYKDGMRNLIKAQLDTLIEKGIRHVVFTAFGCGTRADNPGKQVAAIYKEEIEERREHFDVIAFSVLLRFPSNYVPFAEAFGVENRIIAKHTNSVAAWKNKGNMSDFIMSLHKKKAKRILRNAQMRGEL